jgi:phage major head subunit gpT-like protein
MKKLVDEPGFEKLSAYSWEIANSTYVNGIEVDREDIEDDSLGLVAPTIAEMGAEAKRHPGELLWNLLNGGFAALCYDGQFFFDTDHVDEGGAAQSNKMSGAPSALQESALITALGQMRRIKDPKGRPMGIRPSHLIVPPELEFTAKKLLVQSQKANGESNIFQGQLQLIVSEYLTSATAWFLADLTRALKPLILQNRIATTFDAQDSPTDENAFLREKYRWKARGRYAAGYGLWQFMLGSVGA